MNAFRPLVLALAAGMLACSSSSSTPDSGVPTEDVAIIHYDAFPNSPPSKDASADQSPADVYVGVPDELLQPTCPPSQAGQQIMYCAEALACVDLKNAPGYCGSCTTACGPGYACNAGTCGCPAGTAATKDGGPCVVLDSGTLDAGSDSGSGSGSGSSSGSGSG